MEHLVTIAFDFDDKTVADKISKTVEKQVTEEIKKEVEAKLFEKARWPKEPDPARDPLSLWTRELVREIFLENKDAIVERASEILADSYRRTKVWKEAAAGKIQETEDEE